MLPEFLIEISDPLLNYSYSSRKATVGLLTHQSGGKPKCDLGLSICKDTGYHVLFPIFVSSSVQLTNILETQVLSTLFSMHPKTVVMADAGALPVTWVLFMAPWNEKTSPSGVLCQATGSSFTCGLQPSTKFTVSVTVSKAAQSLGLIWPMKPQGLGSCLGRSLV